MQYEKYINGDGQVAVLYSPGYGAGWYTWNYEDKHKGLLFDKEIVQAIIDDDYCTAIDIAERKYPGCCVLGIENVVIEWLEPGTVFEVKEHDGYERIDILSYNALCA